MCLRAGLSLDRVGFCHPVTLEFEIVFKHTVTTTHLSCSKLYRLSGIIPAQSQTCSYKFVPEEQAKELWVCFQKLQVVINTVKILISVFYTFIMQYYQLRPVAKIQ